MSSSSISEQLIQNGFYVGHISDLIPDPEMVIALRNIINSDFDNNPHNWKYRNDLSEGERARPDLGHHVRLEDIPERRNLIERDNLRVTQQWYERGLGGIDRTVHEYFRVCQKKFLEIAYPDIMKADPELFWAESLAIYEKDDFILPHNDGKNPGRICAIIIYLTPQEDYKDGGGRLLVNGNLTNNEVLPVWPNFIVLDFTENNCLHEVEKVINDFRRISLLSFIGERDKMNLG